MKDTITYHFPFEALEYIPPYKKNTTYKKNTRQVTVIIQRTHEELWKAGVAICGPRDQFCKRTGRRIAEGRLQHKPVLGTSAKDLIQQILHKISEVNYNRQIVSGYARRDLFTIKETIQKMRTSCEPDVNISQLVPVKLPNYTK